MPRTPVLIVGYLIVLLIVFGLLTIIWSIDHLNPMAFAQGGLMMIVGGMILEWSRRSK